MSAVTKNTNENAAELKRKLMKLTAEIQLVQRPVEHPCPIWVLPRGKRICDGLGSVVRNLVACASQTQHMVKDMTEGLELCDHKCKPEKTEQQRHWTYCRGAAPSMPR